MRSWLLMFLLLSSILIQDAQGMRLISKGSAPSDIEQHSLHVRMMRSEGGIHENKSKKTDKKKRKLSSRVRKEAHHWLPRIHEDYYGPRMHRPKHH